LAEVVVEVDRLVGLVRGEEVTGGELELSCGLVAGEDHVGDVFADGGMEGVEDGVVGGLLVRVGSSGGNGAIDVAEVAGTTEGQLHVDRPLGVVVDGEGEDDRADMTGCTPGSDRADGKGAGLRGTMAPAVTALERGVRDMRGQRRWMAAAALEAAAA
jgi:hypothetical protein